MFEQLLQLDVITCLIVAIFFLILGYRPPWWYKKTNTYNKQRSVEDIPGPVPLSILGTRWVFSFGGYKFSKIHEFYKEMKDKYGPIFKEEALFNIPVISIFEKNDIEKVLRSSGKYPIRPPTEAIAHYRKSRPDRYSSTGIVNEQGEKWHFLRTSLTTDLTSPRTICSFLPQIEEIADDWCYLLKQQCDLNGQISNLEEIAGRLGLEATCALVLGRRMGFLLPGEESESTKKFADAVHEHFKACRDTYYGLPLWKIFPTKSYKNLVKSEEIIYQLASQFIESANEVTTESAIFQSVLKAEVDEREKTAAIVDFIAAGIHTLKNSLLFLLYHLAQNPEAQNKLVNDPTNAYLKACIMETFRISPTANCLARVTEEDLELSGFKINRGNVIICHTGLACLDEHNFAKPSEFRPERWLNEEKAGTMANATYLVTPFGYGRRICPGKRFIEQVLPVILERTIKSYVISVDKPLELQFEFLLTPKTPIPMCIQERV